MPSEARTQRFHQVLDQRLVHVHCAIEAIYHRHNVSAVLRTCDSLGIHNVHLVEGHFVPAKGTSRGAERWLDLQQHASPTAAIEAIRRAGCSLWVADLDDDSVAPEAVPLDRPVCLWFGAELAGVSAEARAAADGVVTIPMRGFAQSLNISVAAAMSLRPVAERARLELGARALLTPEARAQLWERWVARDDAMKKGVKAVASLKLGDGS